jgi:MFS superfamily sulfate permease-like transporter
MDVTAVEMIRDLIAELDRKGIILRLANASGQVRDVLRAAGIEELVGRLDGTTTIAALCGQDESILARGRPPTEP